MNDLDVVITVRAEGHGNTFKIAKILEEVGGLTVYTVLNTTHTIFGHCDKSVFVLLSAHPSVERIEENE